LIKRKQFGVLLIIGAVILFLFRDRIAALFGGTGLKKADTSTPLRKAL